MRDLVDATIRTTVDQAEVEAVTAEVASLVRRLRTSQIDGPAGVRVNHEGKSWNWGNATVGLRNAIAPPLVIEHDEPGVAWAELDLGAAYEGPPGMVHGGVCALLLDQLMGETATIGYVRVAFTGTLSVTYRKPTPLGPIRIDARVDREEGRKIYVVATVRSGDDVCVEAEGIFVEPGWAVKLREEPGAVKELLEQMRGG